VRLSRPESQEPDDQVPDDQVPDEIVRPTEIRLRHRDTIVRRQRSAAVGDREQDEISTASRGA
jgi:hypothetical protein